MQLSSFRRKFFLLWPLAALLLAVLSCARTSMAQSNDSSKPTNQNPPSSADKPDVQDNKTSAPGTTRLKIVVTNSADKPVGNASVYVRFNEPGGFLHKDKLAELSFKTNGDGTVKVPGVPQGKILIQVIAKGWHTYGKWYDIEKDQDTIEIKLDPPPHWY
jgi:hypothetical protein